MEISKDTVLKAHARLHGKLQITSKVPVFTQDDLSIFYTPGVAYVSNAIKEDKELAYKYTMKANSVAIITDGTRILGLGDIGPEAGLPVMETKAIIYKRFADIDAFPLCVASKDANEIVRFGELSSPNFAAIHIEDIESPKCFEIVDSLSKKLDIPVFHDDQHGTAMVAAAGMINAVQLAGKRIRRLKVVINGAGAAGFGIASLLYELGVHDVYVVDKAGIIYKGRKERMNRFKQRLAAITNPYSVRGTLADAVCGADVLIGVSTAGAFNSDMIKSMAAKPIVFSLANPVPEMGYADMLKAGAFIAATGRSNDPNQVNNMIGYPAIMLGLIAAKAKKVTYGQLAVAAQALAKSVKSAGRESIMPDIRNKAAISSTFTGVAVAVATAAMSEGNARFRVSAASVRRNALKRLSMGEKLVRLSAELR